MILKISALLVSLLLGAQQALACGSKVGGLQPGNKVVAIEIKKSGMGMNSSSNSPSQHAMDDDGALVIALVAAACNAEIPGPEVKLTEDQKKCADDSQAEAQLKFDEEVKFYYYDSKIAEKTKALEILKNKCQLDALALWQDAKAKIDDLPVKCVDEARGIVKKAVARNAEYMKEQSDPKYLSKINAPESTKIALVENLKNEHKYFQELADMFSSTPVKAKDFQKWLKNGLQEVASRHSYQLTKSPNDKFNADENVGLNRILSSLSAPLPFVPRMRCGGGFPRNTLETLKTAIWEPRSSSTTGSGNNLNQRGSQ